MLHFRTYIIVQFTVLLQKTGKWNAMHVRVAWEIYHHQQKGGLTGESKVGTLVGKSDMLRPPTHMFGPPHAYPPSHRAPPAFDPAPPPTFPPIGKNFEMISGDWHRNHGWP